MIFPTCERDFVDDVQDGGATRDRKARHDATSFGKFFGLKLKVAIFLKRVYTSTQNIPPRATPGCGLLKVAPRLA